MADFLHFYGLTRRPSLRDKLRLMTAESNFRFAKLGFIHLCHFVGPRMTCDVCGHEACDTNNVPYADYPALERPTIKEA